MLFYDIIDQNSWKIRRVFLTVTPKIPTDIEVSELNHWINSFRIRFPAYNRTFGLSIAYPCDMMYGYCETAFLDENKRTLIYRDHLGYDDIKRFNDADELLAEINYLNETLKRSELVLKKGLQTMIKRRRARQTIQRFILEYKDHFIYRPFGSMYKRLKADFDHHMDILCR